MNKDPSQPQDEVICSRARAAFEESVSGLDQATGNRLRLMRREALAAARRPAPTAWGLPFAAAAVAVLAIGLAWHASTTPGSGKPTHAPRADEASATGFPSDEDADLYAWLGEAPVAPAEGGAL